MVLDWLKDGAPHCNVRLYYVDTDWGLKKPSDAADVDKDEPEPSIMCC